MADVDLSKLTTEEGLEVAPGVRLRLRSLADYRQNEENPVSHTPRNLGAVIESIHKVGAARSGFASKGKILAGNLTWDAMTEAGIEGVVEVTTDGTRWVMVNREDLSPEQEKQAAHADQWSAMLAEINVDQLLVDIEEGINLDGIYSEFDLKDILGDALAEAETGEAPEAQIDKGAELAEKYGVKTGQVWQLGEHHRLAIGDCTDKTTVDMVMRGERAQLGLTSPPYAVGKEYEKDTSFEQHLNLLRGFADRALETIEPGGFLFVNFGEIAPQSHTKPLTGSDRQCLYLISKDYWQIFHVERGMDLYAMRIWYKPFNRLQQPFWTYHTSIPHHQEWEHIWTWRLPGGEDDQCFDWDISSRAVWDTRNEAVDDKPLTRHVAAFPVGIPERAIKAHSASGAIIWDPFVGSGTTLVVCEYLGRKCRAMEVSPEYSAVSIRRWEDATGEKAVLLAD